MVYVFKLPNRVTTEHSTHGRETLSEKTGGPEPVDMGEAKNDTRIVLAARHAMDRTSGLSANAVWDIGP